MQQRRLKTVGAIGGVVVVGIVLCLYRMSCAVGADSHSDKPFAAQSTVALKAPFGTIGASSPAVKSANDAKDLQKAATLVGKTASFTGTVSDVYIPQGNEVVLLDFAKEYKSAITAVVQPPNYAKFPDLDLLDGKQVLLTGPVINYHGRAEVQLSSTKQLKVVVP